ncbi:iron ABC transporter permease [Streptomyces sp. TRM 70351]|uniref:FecCD family ABC transporter permease n=1 Tax=Streptomyces sp. TRM 70351 TaxID=3116552 RepID=UPI002E7C11ED|nr:iron ABC transporter permease [Streptomyces sp. TRM 70351]MEE1930506.1 iron ABC transporter permease [Streptomyces sp. TRM 70351]
MSAAPAARPAAPDEPPRTDGGSVPRSAARVPGRTPLRLGPVSGVWRPRTVLVPLVLAAVLAAAVVVNTGRGDFPLSPGEVVEVLLGGGEGAAHLVVWELRLPRSVVGALVGASLALAGAILQGIARNPLASPEILGITAGAGVGAVSVIVLAGAHGSVSGPLADLGVPGAAVTGGLLAAVVVYLLAVRRGITGYRVLLVGVGVNAALTSVLSWLLVKADIVDAGRALIWLNGSLNATSWATAVPVGWALAVLLPMALVLSHQFGALAFDDDTARGLGVRMTGARLALLLTAVLLTAVATAAAGPVAFVALASPQLALRLLRCGHPPLLASALLGAAVTVWADVLGRTAFPGVELPVGILTAVLGAPYLLYLLIRSGKART